MPKASVKGGYGLRDSPFFRLRSRKKLAKLLHISQDKLASLIKADPLYERRWKHKKIKDHWRKTEPSGENSDEYRPIDIPDPRLKMIQTRIAGLLSRVSSPEFLFSPVRGRSYVDNAKQHIDGKAFWLLDVADYFPSCTVEKVSRFFKHDLECSADVTAVLVKLVSLHRCLPQGSPCSPILAYFSNLRMWQEVATLVSESGCKLSVYVDDITISGMIVRKAMIWRVKQILLIRENHPAVITL